MLNKIIFIVIVIVIVMVDSFNETAADLQFSIINKPQMISKRLDANTLCLNIAKSKFMLFHM